MDDKLFINKANLQLEDLIKFCNVHTKKKFIEVEFCILFIGVFVGVLLFFINDILYAAVAWLITAVTGVLYPICRTIQIKKSYKISLQDPSRGGKGRYEMYTFNNDAVYTKSVNSDGVEFASQMLFYDKNFIKALILTDVAYLYIAPNNALIIKCDNMTKGTFIDLLDFLKTKFSPKIYIDKRRQA